MNDESRRILRCDECEENNTKAEVLFDGTIVFPDCTHEHACKRAYRLGTHDMTEAMQDDGR